MGWLENSVQWLSDYFMSLPPWTLIFTAPLFLGLLGLLIFGPIFALPLALHYIWDFLFPSKSTTSSDSYSFDCDPPKKDIDDILRQLQEDSKSSREHEASVREALNSIQREIDRRR